LLETVGIFDCTGKEQLGEVMKETFLRCNFEEAGPDIEYE
jgi:hypothetical protein